MSTNQLLASFYNASIAQELTIGGALYRHDVNQEWYIVEGEGI
jgi:hypothetical protein